MTNEEILHRLRARIPADVFVVVEARLKELDAAKKALMVCDGAMMGRVKPSSPAFRLINKILRPGICVECGTGRGEACHGHCVAPVEFSPEFNGEYVAPQPPAKIGDIAYNEFTGHRSPVKEVRRRADGRIYAILESGATCVLPSSNWKYCENDQVELPPKGNSESTKGVVGG